MPTFRKHPLTKVFALGLPTGTLFLFASIAASTVMEAVGADAETDGVGLFVTHQDIGECPKAGVSAFDAKSGEYRITGGGANIWFATDAFQFAAKPIRGDFTLTADVHFEGTGAVAHRKAVLMARQSMDANSAYADLALHGDGLTSLQYRPSAGAKTLEGRADLKAPQRIRLERRGSVFTAYAGGAEGRLQPIAVAVVQLSEPVYVGLAFHPMTRRCWRRRSFHT